MERLNKRPNDVHVLDTVVEGLERLVVLDVLVLRKGRCGLALLHVLEKALEVVGVDVVPESLFPGLELAVDDGDKIPKLLELDELVLAVIKFLLLGSLELE